MTVRELIKELKKMPSEAKVAFANHDQGQQEIDDFINSVTLVDFDGQPCETGYDLSGDYVVLRS